MATYILPNDNILDLSKLKVFADDKIRVIHKVKLDFGRVETLWKMEKKVAMSIFNFKLISWYFWINALLFQKKKNDYV